MNAASTDLVDRIRRALAEDERVAELSVEVEVVEDDVYLRGVVSTEERVDAIGEIAQRIAPGLSVHNDVAIERLHAPTEERIT